MRYQVKPGVHFDVEPVTGSDGNVDLYEIDTNNHTGKMQVTREVLETFFEPVPDEPVDLGPSVNDFLEVREGDNGEFYWHRQAANGRLIASGGEGFTRKFDAEQAAVRANPGVKLRTDLD